MRETRKQLIEILEPYMDKTLSEGCWVEYRDKYWTERTIMLDWRHQIFSDKFSNYVLNWIHKVDLCITCTDIQNREYRREYIPTKILGHYDITAVLKYINKKWYTINNSEIRGDWIIDWKEYEDKYFWHIKYRPLNLYSEQQEADLLELLKKLR
jgi:hypothetical protein